MKKLEKEDKKVQKKRRFDWDKAWIEIKDESNQEELEKSKIETGWKIKHLKKKG